MAQYLRLPWPWLSTMVTAWAGQARAHFLQPRHISRSTWATQFDETIAPVIPLRRIDCIIPQQQPQQLQMYETRCRTLSAVCAMPASLLCWRMARASAA